MIGNRTRSDFSVALDDAEDHFFFGSRCSVDVHDFGDQGIGQYMENVSRLT